MIQRIKELLRTAPFVPFKIKTSDGKEYLIATSDHAAVAPSNSRLFVFGDDESQTMISGFHLVAVEENASLVK